MPFVIAVASLLGVLPSRARAQCAANDPGFVGDVARVLDEADHRWWADRPLSEGRNAHRTNTTEEFERALKSNANWFEGDVRVEINHKDRLEMRHDVIHETGNNLTLKQWLDRGNRSGRGLKLDIKETALMPLLMKTVHQSGVPDERLMFNLGDYGMNRWGGELRAQFPNARLEINPANRLGSHAYAGGPIQDWQIDRMIALQARFGGPTTFILPQEEATPAAVARLQQIAPVSIWGDVPDPAARRAQLLAMGVAGIIDLQKPAEHGLDDRIAEAVNVAHSWWDRHF